MHTKSNNPQKHKIYKLDHVDLLVDGSKLYFACVVMVTVSELTSSGLMSVTAIVSSVVPVVMILSTVVDIGLVNDGAVSVDITTYFVLMSSINKSSS